MSSRTQLPCYGFHEDRLLGSAGSGRLGGGPGQGGYLDPEGIVVRVVEMGATTVSEVFVRLSVG